MPGPVTCSMTASIKTNITIGLAILSLCAGALCCTSDAQQRVVNYTGAGGIGPTVSVASLRIPDKAWRHFAKAKSLDQRNQIVEADVETEKAIAIDPDLPPRICCEQAFRCGSTVTWQPLRASPKRGALSRICIGQG